MPGNIIDVETGESSSEANVDIIQEDILLQHCAIGQKLQEVIVEDCGPPHWQESAVGPTHGLAFRKFACFTGSVPSTTMCEIENSLQYDRNIDAERFRTVENLANRAFSLGSLLELLCLLLDVEAAFAEVPDVDGAYVYHSGIPLDQWPDLSFFDPATTQTWEVTYRFLVPLSKCRQCPCAKIMTGHEDCPAQRMVSHTWENLFVDTIAACVAAVQEKQYFFHIRPRLRYISRVQELMQDLGATALATTFWLCAISVNQHTVACHESPWPCPCSMQKITDGPRSEVGCFDLMMQYLDEIQGGCAQVIAVDGESHVEVEVQAADWGHDHSIARSPVHRSSNTWCGFRVRWSSRCITRVWDVPNTSLSRSVYVGDIIVSVNVSCDVRNMRDALSCRSAKVKYP